MRRVWSIVWLMIILACPGAVWGQETMVAYYPFDGNTKDMSGMGNDGDNHGGIFVPGVKGQGLSFDGIDDYVRVNATIDFNFGSGSATLSAWVRTTASGDLDVILGNNWNPSEFMVIRKNKKDRAEVIFSTGQMTKGQVEGTTPINDGTWHHIVGVRDAEANRVRLYVDGVEEGSVFDDSGDIVDLTDLGIGNLIGSTNYAGVLWFDGDIDEVKIYNYAITAKEIRAMYDDIMLQPRLVAYYPLDGDVNDYSGNGNTAASIGGTFRTGIKGQALDFNGADAYVRVPESRNYYIGEGGGTISAWIKTESSGSPGVILGTNWATAAYIQLIKDSSGKAQVTFQTDSSNRGTATGTTTISDGQWHMVTGVRDATNELVRIYVDGDEEGYAHDSSGSIDNTNDWGIGSIMGATNYPAGLWFDGLIDDVKIYNYALPPGEIMDEYRSNIDTDDDGIMDIEDLCPHEAGPECNTGCPTVDSDGDGFQESSPACPDYDLCPDEASGANHGCIGVPETTTPPTTAPQETTAPTTPSPKDSDGDGWTDEYEQRAGTDPFIRDSDNDGLIDSEDPNPLQPRKRFGICGPSALLVLGLIPVFSLRRLIFK